MNDTHHPGPSPYSEDEYHLTCSSSLQATALRNVWTKLTAPNKGAEGTLFQALTFLLPIGLPLVIFRTVRICQHRLSLAPLHDWANWGALCMVQAASAAQQLLFSQVTS